MSDVYRSKIADVDELKKVKTRLIDELAQFDQSIVECRYQPVASSSKRLCPCIRGHTSSINFDNFETNCYTNL